jgi:hypothetical protein
MARLYETKDEQANRELYDYYAGREPAPATIPPRIVKTRPRYQPITTMYRKQVDAYKRAYRAFRRVHPDRYTGS